MPRQTRKEKIKTEEQEKSTQIKRKFVDAKISKHLHCCICFDVFNDPVFGPCQHSYCRQCINQTFSISETKTFIQCAQCRQKIYKTQIKKNLLAFQLINELEIFCPNRGCSWKGALDGIGVHMPICGFQEGKLPSWFQSYMKSRENQFQEEEEAQELLPDELRNKLNQENDLPLAVRLFTQSNQNKESLAKVIGFQEEMKDQKTKSKTTDMTSQLKEWQMKFESSEDEVAEPLNLNNIFNSQSNFNQTINEVKTEPIQKLIEQGFSELKATEAYQIFENYDHALNYLLEQNQENDDPQQTQPQKKKRGRPKKVLQPSHYAGVCKRPKIAESNSLPILQENSILQQEQEAPGFETQPERINTLSQDN